MKFTFKGKSLAVAGALVAALASNVIQASMDDYDLPFTYQQISEAHGNESVLYGRGDTQYKVASVENSGCGLDENSRVSMHTLTSTDNESFLIEVNDIPNQREDTFFMV
ncbi:MAG: hypothetical protein GY915_00125 [bacterium]|nr:hypothetical protein [bacterium]